MGGCVLPRQFFWTEYEKRAKSGATGPIVGGTCWKSLTQKADKKGDNGDQLQSVNTHPDSGEINPTDCQEVVGWSLMARQNLGQKTGQNLTKATKKATE